MARKFKKKMPADSGALSDVRDAHFPSHDSGLNKPADLDTSATPSPVRHPLHVPPHEARTSGGSTEMESAKAGHNLATGRLAEAPDAGASPTAGTHLGSFNAKKVTADIAPSVDPMQNAAAMMGKNAPGATTPGLWDAVDDLVPHLNKMARCLPKKKDVSDLTLTLEGASDAVGIDTLAQGDMFARLIDKGKVSIAFGSASFSAVAESTGDELAFASAFSDAHVSGADFVISWTRHESVNLESNDGRYAKDVSTTYVFALDFEAWDLRRGPITVDADRDKSFFGELCWLPDLIEGNLATFNVDVQAAGENTYADVVTSVLAVEDQLSSVSAIGHLGIG
jgi:hypothetical protein